MKKNISYFELEFKTLTKEKENVTKNIENQIKISKNDIEKNN